MSFTRRHAGADKAIVLNSATHTISAVLAQRFDPDYPDSAKNRPDLVSAFWMMHRDPKSAFPDLTWYECGVGQTVKPVTAEIVSHGLHNAGCTGADEANGPMDLHPGASATLSYHSLRLVERTRVQVTVDGFRQHKKVPDAKSIFRAINEL